MFFVCFFVLFLFFIFIKISKFALPGVMLMYERTSNERKKERNFTTAGDSDCVAAVERLPALHYIVDFIFVSFGIMIFTVEL